MSEVCAICLSDLGDDPSLLQTWTGCNGHTFHKACLCGWLMQGKQTCPSCRSNLMVNKDSDVESVISADSESSSDSDESSASSVSSVASSSSSSSSSSSYCALPSIAGTSPPTSSDEEEDDDEDFLSVYRRVSITIPEGLIDAENKHTKNFHDSYDGIMETGVRWILDTIMNCTPILMWVTVPDDLYPGELMTVTSPSGQNLVVVVPPYRLRGDRFTVLVPR